MSTSISRAYPAHVDTLDCYCNPTAFWMCDCLHAHLASGKSEKDFILGQKTWCSECEGSGFVKLATKDARGKAGPRLALSHSISSDEQAALRPQCRRCGQTLDKWGEHSTACRPIERLPSATKSMRIVAPASATAIPTEPQQVRRRTTHPESRQTRMIALVSAEKESPSSAGTIAAALGISPAHASIALCIAVKQGRIVRVGRGRFVRPA